MRDDHGEIDARESEHEVEEAQAEWRTIGVLLLVGARTAAALVELAAGAHCGVAGPAESEHRGEDREDGADGRVAVTVDQTAVAAEGGEGKIGNIHSD